MRSVRFLFIGMLVYQTGLFVWVEPSVCMTGNVGADEFKQKIDALKNLQEKVTRRIDTALAIRADLTIRRREFTDEINAVQQRRQFHPPGVGLERAVRKRKWSGR